MTPHKMRASRTTPLQHRGRNADPVQAATPVIGDTSIGTCALPALETEIQFEICIFILDGKSDKQVSTCGHNFKIEVVSHIPVVLVGECFPQTLLLLRAVWMSIILGRGQTLHMNVILHKESESIKHFGAVN